GTGAGLHVSVPVVFARERRTAARHALHGHPVRFRQPAEQPVDHWGWRRSAAADRCDERGVGCVCADGESESFSHAALGAVHGVPAPHDDVRPRDSGLDRPVPRGASRRYRFSYVNPSSWARPMAHVSGGTSRPPATSPPPRSARISCAFPPVAFAMSFETDPSAKLHCQNTTPRACSARTVAPPPPVAAPRKM